MLLDQAEFLGQLIHGAFFAALFCYAVRDLIRGENGITKGLIFLGIGSTIMAAFSIFHNLTGQDYELITRWGNTAGVWIGNVGAFFIVQAIVNHKD